MADEKVTQFQEITNLLDTDLIPAVRPTELDPANQNKYITGANAKNQLRYPTVNDFASLPPAGDHSGQVYVVLTSTGVYLINRKESGMYYSNGASWTRLGDIPSFFSDDTFMVYDGLDNSKQVVLEVGSVSTGTQRVISIPDENVNLGDISLNTALRHDPVTVSDSSEIDLTLTGQNIEASIVAGSISESKLSISVNNSLALADSALQEETDTLQTVTARGANTTETVTLSPTGNNNALIANGSGSGAAVSITHSGAGDQISGTGFNISSTGGVTATSAIITNGELDVNTTVGNSVIRSHAQGVADASDLILENATGEWRLRNNGTNNDLIFTKDAVNALIFGGNVTSGTYIYGTQTNFTINSDGIDRDTTIQGATDTSLVYVDAGNDRVGIGTATPSDKLDVVGNVVISGTINTGQGATELYLMDQNVRTTDSPTFAGATFNGNPTVSVAGTAGFTIIDTTRGTALLNAGAEFDFRWSKTTGAAIMDFEGRPLDGTSNAEYRFGLNSGSTGENRIILFASNGTTRHTQIQTSGTSYMCQSGGSLAIGGTSQLSGAELSVYGEIVNKTSTTAVLTNNGDFEITTPDDTTVTFNYRGSDGVTRSVSLTLA